MSSAVLLSMMGLYMGRCVYLLPLRPKHFIHGICRALKASNGDGITPYEAFSAALGGCVGTGNIAGVAGAIAILAMDKRHTRHGHQVCGGAYRDKVSPGRRKG